MGWATYTPDVDHGATWPAAQPDGLISALRPTAATFRIVDGLPTPVPAIPWSIPPPQPESTARRAYLVREIRQALLAALSKSDLVSFLRVERAVFEDVARELYYEIGYDRVNLRMDRSTARSRIYCDAVRVVDARAMTITNQFLDGVGVDLRQRKQANRPQNRAKYLDVFRADVLDVVVPPLRQRCRGIRKILLGTGSHNFGPPFWVVQFDHPWRWADIAEDEDLPYPSTLVIRDPGHIDYVSTCEFDIPNGPPSGIRPPPTSPSPSSTYTVRYRYDVTLRPCTPVPSSDIAEQWQYALTHGPIAEGLYRGLNVNNLPLSLSTLTALYRKQRALGYKDRLNEIHAYNVAPWNITDFRSLAKVASWSMTKLDISDYPERELQTAPPRCTFADLPQLLFTVRHYLLNLKALRCNLGGIEGAEAFCGDMLEPSTLADGGSVRDLYIMTSHFPTPLFNVLRCLSSITTPDAEVEVDHVADWEGQVWDPPAQTALCRYLRKQNPARREHLSTVDFASLGITEPLQVLDLTYDTSGRPKRLAEAKAVAWSKQIKSAATSAIVDLIPKFQVGLLDSTEAAARFQAASASGSASELLDEAQRLLEAVAKTRAAAKALDVVQAGQEADIRAYVAALKADRELASR